MIITLLNGYCLPIFVLKIISTKLFSNIKKISEYT